MSFPVYLATLDCGPLRENRNGPRVYCGPLRFFVTIRNQK